MSDSKKFGRSASFLKQEGADEYATLPLVAFLVAIMATDGADGALFPNVTKALERTVDFNINILGGLATAQAIVQAIFGPFWGVLCARKYMERKTILTTMVFCQGLATLIMQGFVNNKPAMYALRAFNGACLAGLLPVANSIIADKFDDEIRGRMFALMNIARGLGATLFGAVYSITSEWCAADGRLDSCELPDLEQCVKATPPPCECTGTFGWQYSFIITGIVTMLFSPVVYMFMKPPPVAVKNVAEKGQNVVISELKALGKLLCETPTFLVLVVQGCFGGLPWSALQFRGFFFETAGLKKEQVTWIMTIIGFVGMFGGFLSGWLSDALVRIWPKHGRILNAEFSVYGGIPFAFATFTQSWHPDCGGVKGCNALYYYLGGLQVAMHLICGGVGGGTNAPILSQLAEPDERALVIAWQASLEGCIAALGPVIFTTLNAFFGYDADCNNPCPDRPATCKTVEDNIDAAGKALVFTSSVPWVICGMLYTSLHWIYPRDMERIEARRDREKEEEARKQALIEPPANTEMATTNG